MLRFFITTVGLTWLWIWLFWKLVVEEIEVLPNSNLTRVEKVNGTEIFSYKTKRVPAHISQNSLVLIWFASYTYLVAKIWTVWMIILFGLNPPRNEDDQFVGGNN